MASFLLQVSLDVFLSRFDVDDTIFRHTHCKHFLAQDQDVTEEEDGQTLVENNNISLVPEAGVWHVHHLDGANHFTVAPIWFGSQIQKEFWQEMGKWLRQVDVMWSERDLSR